MNNFRQLNPKNFGLLTIKRPVTYFQISTNLNCINKRPLSRIIRFPKLKRQNKWKRYVFKSWLVQTVRPLSVFLDINNRFSEFWCSGKNQPELSSLGGIQIFDFSEISIRPTVSRKPVQIHAISQRSVSSHDSGLHNFLRWLLVFSGIDW
ncbi:hypothetical protein Hanom_Chr11g01055151 [Helianthus anomalus]